MQLRLQNRLSSSVLAEAFVNLFCAIHISSKWNPLLSCLLYWSRSSIAYFLVHRTRKSDRKCSARFFCLVLPVWYRTSGVLVLCLFAGQGYEKNNLLPVCFTSTDLSQSRVVCCIIPVSAKASTGICYNRPPSTEINRSRSNTGNRFYYYKLQMEWDQDWCQQIQLPIWSLKIKCITSCKLMIHYPAGIVLMLGDLGYADYLGIIMTIYRNKDGLVWRIQCSTPTHYYLLCTYTSVRSKYLRLHV